MSQYSSAILYSVVYFILTLAAPSPQEQTYINYLHEIYVCVAAEERHKTTQWLK